MISGYLSARKSCLYHARLLHVLLKYSYRLTCLQNVWSDLLLMEINLTLQMLPNNEDPCISF